MDTDDNMLITRGKAGRGSGRVKEELMVMEGDLDGQYTIQYAGVVS